jgi:prepilin-type N-terminal cleavage/methylation domain-containing protein
MQNQSVLMTGIARRGMTLLEMVISVSILVVVLMLVFTASHFGIKSVQESIETTYVQSKGEITLNALDNDLVESTYLGTYAVSFTLGGTGYTVQDAAINYKVPLAFASSGNPAGVPVRIIDNTQQAFSAIFPVAGTGHGPDFFMQLVFGWRDDARLVANLDVSSSTYTSLQGPGLKTDSGSLPPGIALDGLGRTPAGYMQDMFVPNPSAVVGSQGVFDESVEGIDIDQDGLLQTKFAVGYIERSYCIGTVNPSGTVIPTPCLTSVQSSRTALADSNVLAKIAGPASGTPRNPIGSIFALAPSGQYISQSRLTVSLWVLSVSSADRLPRLVHATSTIFLRNDTSQVQGTIINAP